MLLRSLAKIVVKDEAEDRAHVLVGLLVEHCAWINSLGNHHRGCPSLAPENLPLGFLQNGMIQRCQQMELIWKQPFGINNLLHFTRLAISVRLIKPGKHLKHIFFPTATTNQLKVGNREVALEGDNIEEILQIVSTQMGLESYRRDIASMALDRCLSLSQDFTDPDKEVDNEMGKLPSHFPEVYPNSSWSLYDLNEEGQICQKIGRSKDNQWNVPEDIEDWHPDPPNQHEQETVSTMAAWEAVDLAFLSRKEIKLAVNKVWNGEETPYKGKWKWLKHKDYQLKDANEEQEIRSPAKRTRPEDEPSPTGSPATKNQKRHSRNAGMESLATSLNNR